MSRDVTTLRRQWTLIRKLSASRLGLSVKEIAVELDVEPKTVRRYLNLFREIGFPIVEVALARGLKKYRLDPEVGVPLSFSFDEAVALYLGRRFLEPLAGTAIAEASNTAFDKIRSTLGASSIDYINQFDAFFHQTYQSIHDYSNRSDQYDAIRTAIEDRTVVDLLYQSNSAPAPTFRLIHPYSFVKHNNAIYLLAFDPAAQKIKEYKLDRIEDVELKKEKFVKPADFNAESYLSNSFGVVPGDSDPFEVVVHFAASVARYVLESRWKGCVSLEKKSDGRVVGVFSLSSTLEIKSWVLGFGCSAEIVSPRSLRDEIAADLKALAAIYQVKT
jgi:predicted DNA-binding transcriptional regulator YafY